MNRVTLPAKRVSETLFAGGAGGVSFLSLLGGTETLSTAVCAASVYSGTDANPSAIVSGAASISGSNVLQLVTAGVLGVIYELKFTVTTSLGQTLVLCGYLAIIPDLP